MYIRDARGTGDPPRPAGPRGPWRGGAQFLEIHGGRRGTGLKSYGTGRGGLEIVFLIFLIYAKYDKKLSIITIPEGL